MDLNNKEQIQSIIKKANNVFVCVSEKANFESFASGLALFLSLKKAGKSVSIMAKSPTVSDANLLYGVDKIGKVHSSKNLIISIDNAIKNVDKITYFLQENKLKIVVHAFPGTDGVSENEIVYERGVVNPDLIFSIGHISADELSNQISQEQKISPETVIVNLNNSQQSQKFAQLSIHNQTPISQSVTQLMADIPLPMDEDISFNLYAGLASATKMFSPENVTEETFNVARLLIKHGAGNANMAKRSVGNVDHKQKIDFDLVPNQNQEDLQVGVSKFDKQDTLEEAEVKDQDKEAWLKPPKIYHGSKSFDIES